MVGVTNKDSLNKPINVDGGSSQLLNSDLDIGNLSHVTDSNKIEE